MEQEPQDINIRPPRKWLTPVVWALLLLGLAGIFADNAVETWARWFPAWHYTSWSLYDRIVGGQSYYTHGPLVPLVSILAALLLIRHVRIPVRPSRALGGAVLGLSLVVQLLACLARVNFASGFALIGVLAGLVLLFWGTDALRRLWFPLAFLVFMIPMPVVTVEQVNFRMKLLASDWSVSMANFFGVVAERSGNRVFLQGGKQLVIANVCNGLRTLISVLAFGAVYAYVCRLRGFWRLWLFVMAVPVAVASNALRIVGLIVVADLWDEKTATGWFHDASGVLIFVMAFLLMFALERAVLAVRKWIGRPAKIAPLFEGITRGPEDEGQWSKLKQAVAGPKGVVVCVVLLLATPYAWWLTSLVPSSGKGNVAASSLPRELTVEGRLFRSDYDRALDEQTLAILETHDYLDREYACPDRLPINFSIIFSEDNRRGIHPPDLCLEGAGEGILGKGDVVLRDIPGRGEVACRELLVVMPNMGGQYYLYTYKCGGGYTGSFWRQQFTIMVNGLVNSNASGALIRVATPAPLGDWAEARGRATRFLQVALPYLDSSLP